MNGGGLGGGLLVLALLLTPRLSHAAPIVDDEEPLGETTISDSDDEPSAQDPPEGRASSTVRRGDLQRRLPRSAPDAVRYEPGVFVQQTAHGQASVFLRGLTGQQTVLLFDGIRLNTSTWRQGPNQYFFTLDSGTLEAIHLQRGGASTRYGSDALGGAILTEPTDPAWGTDAAVTPRLFLRGATADEERGGRLELDARTGHALSVLAGFGGRRVGLLESGGVVLNPQNGARPDVPRFEPDDRTMLGTGFDEWTADLRVVGRAGERHRFTTAAYLYRQLDAPRTDQCPPPAARFDECLTYDEQFRTLAYGRWELLSPAAGLATVSTTFSWQRQHEKRRNERPASFVVSHGEDDVDTYGLTVRADGVPFALGGADGPTLAIEGGAETYVDAVTSRADLRFTDVEVTLPRSRGQYLSGSRYLQSALFGDVTLALGPRWVIRTGARGSFIRVTSPADPESGTLAVDRDFLPFVGHAGVEWRRTPRLSWLLNVDHSFRAPNLDDLTSRQQAGPGFQLENAALRPERATTLELGGRWRHPAVSADLWLFQTWLRDAIARRPIAASECPPETPQCAASWSRFQLANADDAAVVRGLELGLRWRPWQRLSARSSLSWTWGEGPNVADPPSEPALPYEERIPLSRIPPINGTVELLGHLPREVTVGAAVRWATAQERLALSDRSDARIPLGGTPGFAVADLRAGWRWGRRVRVQLALENVFDAAYRYHGSSVNGPGRGMSASLELSPF